jgi:flagellar biosynthesis/type III secretory pathway protein FliH
MTNGPTAAAQPPGPDAGGGPNRAVLITVAVLVLAGVAVGAYFIGRSAADADAAEERGVEKGRQAVSAQYERGAAGYERIYQAGFRAGQQSGERAGQARGEAEGAERGRRAGVQQGERVGRLEGERQGIEEGAQAALGGFTAWEAGAWYVVKYATGQQGVPYAVSARHQMSTNDRYAICADNPANICTEPITGG